MSITALIPAYNEEKTIARVIEAIKNTKLIDDILVIDDGSSDKTSLEADKAGARVIRLNQNCGKGAALQRGIAEIESNIILMLDADLVGLKKVHIENLLQPLEKGEADMAVGVFNDGRGLTDLAQFFAPNLSGQRAVRRDVISDINNLHKAGYGVEVAINHYVKKRGSLKFVELPELTHVMKEEKRGLARGVVDRGKMYWDILRVLVKDQFLINK